MIGFTISAERDRILTHPLMVIFVAVLYQSAKTGESYVFILFGYDNNIKLRNDTWILNVTDVNSPAWLSAQGPSQNPSSDDNGSAHTLSTGAIIGISIGSAVVGVSCKSDGAMNSSNRMTLVLDWGRGLCGDLVLPQEEAATRVRNPTDGSSTSILGYAWWSWWFGDGIVVPTNDKSHFGWWLSHCLHPAFENWTLFRWGYA